MGGIIRRCTDWQDQHSRPRYTLGEVCPACEASTEPAAPARFDPSDPYGEYRRRLRQKEDTK